MSYYFKEMEMPISGQPYKRIGSKTTKKVLTDYPGFFDSHLAHGWLGDVYVLWQVALMFLYLGMFSTGIQIGYLAIIIPGSIEAFVVLLGNGILAYLTYRADKSHRLIIRHKVDIKNNHVKDAAIAKANADNDQSYFIAGFWWNVATFTLMIVFATSVTVSPNINEGAPATVINYNQGLLDNFKMPIRPELDGTVNVVFCYVLLLLIKSTILAAAFFDRTLPSALRQRLNKIDEAIDEATKKERLDGVAISDEQAGARYAKHNVEAATASRDMGPKI